MPDRVLIQSGARFGALGAEKCGCLGSAVTRSLGVDLDLQESGDDIDKPFQPGVPFAHGGVQWRFAFVVANVRVGPFGEEQLDSLELTEERRVDLVKVIKAMAEESRIRVRASRKDGMDAAKKMKADNVLTEDQMHDLEKNVQEITDKHIKEIDAKVGDKEKEVMTV